MIRRGLTISARRLAVRRALFAPVQQRVVNPVRALSVTPRVNLPSHELVPLPALSPTMEVGTIKSWEVITFKFIISTLKVFTKQGLFWSWRRYLKIRYPSDTLKQVRIKKFTLKNTTINHFYRFRQYSNVSETVLEIVLNWLTDVEGNKDWAE